MPDLLNYLNALDDGRIDSERKTILAQMANNLSTILKNEGNINLNFICTHNSRRSIFCQVWAHCAAQFYGKYNINLYSGGTKKSTVPAIVLNTLKDAGFRIAKNRNPSKGHILDVWGNELLLYAKMYNSEENPKDYIAVMNCEEAAQYCPFIPEAKKRINLTYLDPKTADGTDQEQQVYFDTCMGIANEMFYLFSKINTNE